MENYKEKIRKLLALAESNNEFEAKSARKINCKMRNRGGNAAFSFYTGRHNF